MIYNPQRYFIGLAVIFFPWILLLGNRMYIEESISQYYFTDSRDLFTLQLGFIAFLFLLYEGYDRWEQMTARTLSLLVLILIIFPTRMQKRSGDGTCLYYRVFCYDYFSFSLADNRKDDALYYTHLISAMSFFILSTVFIFRFRKTHPERIPTRNKTLRNIVYNTCLGVNIIFIILLFLAGAEIIYNPDIYACEVVIVQSIGISWLIKAKIKFVSVVSVEKKIEKIDIRI